MNFRSARTWLVVDCAVLSLLLVIAGGAKVLGMPNFHESFARMGFPIWFGFFVGISELAAAVGLWIPALRRWAAAGLALLLLGAIYYHVVYTPIAKALPAAVMLTMCAFAMLPQRDRLDPAAPAPDGPIGKRASFRTDS